MRLQLYKTRRAVSLTELMILMSATTMILSMSAMLLQRAMRVQMDSRAFADTERSAARLSRQFREDAHGATSAVLEKSKLNKDVFVQLQLPASKSIEYSRVNGNVRRSIMRDSKVAAREEFAFQPSCKLEVREEGSPNRIILTMMSAPLDPASSKEEQIQSYRAAPLGLQVEAVLNRGASVSNSSSRAQQGR
jgi:hypothetical protein